MKSTPSLLKIFPTLHQPLPLTRTQSQRLLDSLKTSFRTNLDREHGWISEDTTTPAKTSSTTTQPDTLAKFRRPTDDHVRAILSNPIIQNGLDKVSAPVTPVEDPMEVFSRAAAKNMMTMNAAIGCMSAKYREAMTSSAGTFSEAVGQWGVSDKVIGWLRSTGQFDTFDWVENRGFVSILVRFMVGEGKDSEAFGWMLHLSNHGEIANATKKAMYMLYVIYQARMLVHLSSGLNLDSAFAAILDSNRYLANSPHKEFIVYKPWRDLSWNATVEAWKHPKPSESLYDGFTSMADQFTHTTQVISAHLDVHHPAHPDYHKAVDCIETFKAQPNTWNPGSFSQRAFANRLFHMAMDTATLLKQTGKKDEAQSILDFLESGQMNMMRPA